MKWLSAIIMLTCILSGCSGCDSADGKLPASKPDKAVIEVGQRDAIRIMSMSGDTRSVESLLIEARAKECFMRSRGLDATASLYIKTIEQTIIDSLPDFAKRLQIMR